MIRTTLFATCFAFTALFLAGCEGTSSYSAGNPQLVAAPDSVSARLAEAADRASNALETLAAVEYSKAPNVSVAPIENAPVELRRAITVNWVGPAEQITQTLADRASYNFLVIGTPPPVPVIVSIDAENMPVVDLLRDIGLQLGVRGNLKVDGGRRVIELHYAPNTGIGP